MSRLAAMCALVVGAGCGYAPAQDLYISSHHIQYDPAQSMVLFDMTFSRPPDFFTLDPGGRQADSFQIYLDTLPGRNGFGGTSPFTWETIVRGEEIHVNGNIRFRDHILGPSMDPISGGWGPIAGTVPYTMTGMRQKFVAPYSVVNTTNGQFSYRVEVFRFGTQLPNVLRGHSEPVPAPAGAAALLVGAGLLASRRRREPVSRPALRS